MDSVDGGVRRLRLRVWRIEEELRLRIIVGGVVDVVEVNMDIVRGWEERGGVMNEMVGMIMEGVVMDVRRGERIGGDVGEVVKRVFEVRDEEVVGGRSDENVFVF